MLIAGSLYRIGSIRSWTPAVKNTGRSNTGSGKRSAAGPQPMNRFSTSKRRKLRAATASVHPPFMPAVILARSIALGTT